MQRKWILVAAGVVLAAGVLVGGQLLLTRRSTPSTTAGAGSSAAGSSATSQSPTSTTAQLAPPRLTAIAPAGLAADGLALHPLSSSPPGLISGMTLGRMPAGSAYAIRFKPWGYGPADRLGGTVAATIVSAAPVSSAPGAKRFVGMVLLLVMDDHRTGVVYAGGTSNGVLTFVKDGTKLAPVLSEVQQP